MGKNQRDGKKKKIKFFLGTHRAFANTTAMLSLAHRRMLGANTSAKFGAVIFVVVVTLSSKNIWRKLMTKRRTLRLTTGNFSYTTPTTFSGSSEPGMHSSYVS